MIEVLILVFSLAPFGQLSVPLWQGTSEAMFLLNNIASDYENEGRPGYYDFGDRN